MSTYGIYATPATPAAPDRQDLAFAPQVIGLDSRLAAPLPEVDEAEIDRVNQSIEAGEWLDGSDLAAKQRAYRLSRPDVQARNRAEAVQQLMHCLPHLETARMALVRLEQGLGDSRRMGSTEVARISNAIHNLVRIESIGGVP